MEKSKRNIEKIIEYFKRVGQDVKVATPLIFNRIYDILPTLLYLYVLLLIVPIESDGIAILLASILLILVALLSMYFNLLKQNIYRLIFILFLFIVNSFLILIMVHLLFLRILFKVRKDNRIYYKYIIDILIFITLFICSLFIHAALATGVILIAFIYILVKSRKYNNVMKYFIDFLIFLSFLIYTIGMIVSFRITSIVSEAIIVEAVNYTVPIFITLYLLYIGIDTIMHLISTDQYHVENSVNQDRIKNNSDHNPTKNNLVLYACMIILVMLILPDFIYATMILDYYFSVYEYKELLISNDENYKEIFRYYLNNFMYMAKNHYNISLHIKGIPDCNHCFKDNLGNVILFLHMLINRMFELVIVGLIMGVFINKLNQKNKHINVR